MKIKTIVSALAASMMLAAPAAVKIGEVGNDFANSLEYAKKHNVPIVVTWGNTSCGYCNTLAKTVDGSADIQKWIDEHKILFVEKHEDYGSKDADYLAAEAWIQSLKKVTDGYPHMGIYWQKSDGTVPASTAFTARKNKMPVSTPKNDFEAQIIGTLEQYIGAYEPAGSSDASFVTTDTETDRLEAESTTRTVYVPLKRESGTKAASCVLRVAYPYGTGPSITVNWAAGETTKNVAVTMPTAGFSVGQSVSLRLESADGQELGTSSILMVAKQENSAKNPHWVGEYTFDTLPYGEWTMDFDTAKQKVAQMGGKLMVMFGGPLWCPNCVVIENDVFNTPTFKAWAKAEKLVLVHFDQGQASSPSTPEGTPRGRLLTTTVSTKGVSGSSYLSRHGIDPSSSTVKDVIDRVTYLTDYWLAPESTAARLANPVVLLLNDAGTTVDARFQRQGDSSTMDLAENMYRFKDLLTLAGANENEGYRTVTPLTIAADGSACNTLHVNASKKFYKVTGAKSGFGLEVTADVADVTLALYAGSEELASAKGTLTYDEPLTKEQADDLYVCVSGFDKAQSTFFGADTSCDFNFTVKQIAVEVIVPFKSLKKDVLKEYNPALYKKQSATVPVYEALNLGGKRLVGTLAVSVTSANKISAKFVGEKTVSFAGTWSEISLATGDVMTTLEKKVSKVVYALDLEMDAEGGFEATVYEAGEELGAGAAAAGDITSYAGSYTVTLVDKDGETGTGYLTVKITNKGKATVSGVMPDGTSVSVSPMLSPNADETATLPIYKTSNKGTLALALTIDPDAEETWGEVVETVGSVRSVTGCLATWETDGETEFDIYGGYWQSTSPLAICESYDLSDELDIVVDGETEDSATATKTGFKLNTKNTLTSLSFAKATGVFSGKAKVLNSAGKSVSAMVKGVLLPGWTACSSCGGTGVERPYGSGTLYYKDGKTTVSMPIDLVAEEEAKE